MTLIDVDEPASWSEVLAEAVGEAADHARGTASWTSDLELDEGDLPRLRAALSRVRVRVFHATRLLPSEIDEIGRDGLLFLDEGLVSSKLRHAVAAGALSESDAAELFATRMPLDGTSGRRIAQICASAGTGGFRDDVHGVAPLLKSWGGEAIYFAHERDELGRRLRTIGRPAVLELAVVPGRDRDRWWPDLEKLLVGSCLGLGGVGADVFIRSAPVAAADILALHTPSSEWWSRYPKLPSA